MILVWGWGNYDRRDGVTVDDTCEACGMVSRLSSYDTLRCFTLFWIPVLPLGRRRIFNECSSCKQARMLSLRKWRRLRSDGVSEALEDLAGDPSDRDCALRALGILIECDERERFKDVVKIIRTPHAGDAQVLIALADAHERLGDPQDALACLRAAHALNAEPPVSLAIAARLIEHGQAAEVVPALERIETEDPTLRPSITSLRNRFEELQRSGEAGAAFATQGRARSSTVPRKLLPLMIVPALILWTLVSFGSKALDARIAHAYLLNGLQTPYDVVLNGTEYRLRPGVPLEVTLRFGEINVAPKSTAAPFTAASTTLEVPFFERVLDDTTLIINPDRAALMILETAVYRTTPREDDGSIDPRYGQVFHVHDDLDYRFQEAPAEISLSSRSAHAVRTALQLVNDLTPPERLQAVHAMKGPDASTEYAGALLATSPNDQFVLGLLRSQLTPDEFLSRTARAREQRPPLVDVHRVYQELMRDEGHEEGLVDEYRRYRAEYPDDRAFAYLLGRLVDEEDLDEALELFEFATSGEEPNLYGYRALSWYHMSLGDYEAALADVRAGLALDPTSPTFLDAEQDYLLATGQHDELLKVYDQWLVEASDDTYAMICKVECLARAGDAEAARNFATLCNTRLEAEQWPADVQKVMRENFELVQAGARLDRDAYLAAARSMEADFHVSLLERDVQRARAALEEETEGLDYSDRLLVHALAIGAGETELATDVLDGVLQELDAGTYDLRTLARWLRAETTEDLPDPRQLAALAQDRNQRPKVMIAFAARFPERRSEYRAAAHAHAYPSGFIRMLADDLIGDD